MVGPRCSRAAPPSPKVGASLACLVTTPSRVPRVLGVFDSAFVTVSDTMCCEFGRVGEVEELLELVEDGVAEVEDRS